MDPRSAAGRVVGGGSGANGLDGEEVDAEVADAVEEAVELGLVEMFGDEASVAGVGFDRDPGNVARNRSPTGPWTVTVYRLDCMVLL